jgi:hypothetical protein
LEAAREDCGQADGDGVSSVDFARSLKGKSPPPPFQVDPKITRPELVGAHAKWLFCSSAFWTLKGQCETKQRFVPDGYWFETGRQPGANCTDLTTYDIPVVTCRVKKGLTMVLPVVNYLVVACSDDGKRDDPRKGVAEVMDQLRTMRILQATLDGANITSFDAILVATQDGDGDYTLPSPSSRCYDNFGIFQPQGGCPLYAAGYYVFIDTKKLAKGAHELVLISDYGGFCFAVKHMFTLY